VAARSAAVSAFVRARPSPSARATPRKPGLFAQNGEKDLYQAVKAQDADAIKQVGEQHPDFRLSSYSIAGLMILDNEPTEAERLLAEAFGTGKDPPRTSSSRPTCSRNSSSPSHKGSRRSFRSTATRSGSRWPS
jgi:hypothetical protein